MQIFIDKKRSKSTAEEIPDFPTIRYDSDNFVWEEAFYNGNYVTIYRSAMGRCLNKERAFGKLEKYYSEGSVIYPYIPAFELEVDGERLRDHWEYIGDNISNTPEGYKECVISLKYGLYPIEVRVRSLLDGSAFLARKLTIINHGEKSIKISNAFTMSGIIAENEAWRMPNIDIEQGFKLGTYHFGKAVKEGEFYWRDLGENTIKFDLKRRSYSPPMYIMKNEFTGENTVIFIEWSGNLNLEFRKDCVGEINWGLSQYDDIVSFKAGPGGLPPQYILKPGSQMDTPSVHISMCYGGFDECVNSLYKHLRTSVVPKQPEGSQHLVEYNHTGYTQNAQISKQLLIDEIDMAAECGVELFMLDAGWFGGEDVPWPEGVGDWDESPLLEGDLLNIFEYARNKGIKCGIWVEIERAHPKSNFAKNHSEYFIKRGNKNFQVLDLSKPEVLEHEFNVLEKIISTYKLECFRLDHNICPSTGGDIIEDNCVVNTSWKYYENLYTLFDRITKRFPGILLENCAGGGGRLDTGMLRRFHWTQITDNWSPCDQIRILNGISLAIPPEQCMPLIGAINFTPADTLYIARTGFFSHMCLSGIFPSCEHINENGLNDWKHTVDLYKNEMRSILDNCMVYHHTPLQDYTRMGEWVVLEYSASDKTKSIAGFFRLSEYSEDVFNFIPRGLDLDKSYDVYFDNNGKTARFSGLELCQKGISVRLPGMMMSELMIMKMVDCSC